MVWTIFVATVMARIAGDVLWHFLLLWLSGREWYQTLCMKVSMRFTKRVVKQFEDEDLL